MKDSTKVIIAAACVGAAAYLFSLNKMANKPVEQGGSLLQQAQDATIGQIIGAPSRAGSTGTIGVIGEVITAASQANQSVFGTPSVNGGVGSSGLVGGIVAQALNLFNSATGSKLVSGQIPSNATNSEQNLSGSSYNTQTNVLTTSQGYQMSVAPSTAGNVAASFAQQQSTQILLSQTAQQKTAAALGVGLYVINPFTNVPQTTSASIKTTNATSEKLFYPNQTSIGTIKAAGAANLTDYTAKMKAQGWTPIYK